MKTSYYQYIGGGIDPVDGWWKYTLRRNDGRIVKVRKARLRELRREGRLCDCQNPEPASGVALVSNECPVHNLHPKEPAQAGRDEKEDA